jgi:hypothetical protein
MSQLAPEPLNILKKLQPQTICVEIVRVLCFYKKQVLHRIIDSQITKARGLALQDHINYNLFNSFTTMWLHNNMFEKRKVKIIRKLVGISEAIRLILIFLEQSKGFLNCFAANSSTLMLSTSVLNIHLSQDNKELSEFIQINKSSGAFSPLPTTHESQHCAVVTLSKEVKEDNINNLTSDSNSLKFNEWLAGLIDGDGYFILTKKNYVSCEICMDIRDKKALYEVKHKYGGSIKPVSGAKALKYKLRNRKGLLCLINNINGLIRNPIRLLQINKICDKYKIDLKYPQPLTYYNG